jgi:hypothetical protein
MKMKTIGDVLKLCRANRYTYYNLDTTSKVLFRQLYKQCKKQQGKDITTRYAIVKKMLKLPTSDIIKKTWAMEYALIGRYPHRNQFTERLLKLLEKN